MAERAREVGRYKGAGRGGDAAQLGEVLRELLEARICPGHDRAASVCAAWSELVPVELGRHCRVGGMLGGTLKVMADSPAYMYEMQLCSAELVRSLQQRCPAAGIRGLKIALE